MKWSSLVVGTAVFVLCIFTGLQLKRVRAPEPSSRTRSSHEAAVNEPRPMTPENATETERAIDQLRLTPLEAGLSAKLGGNEFEVKVRRSLLAGRHANEIPGAEGLGLYYLNELKTHPEQGMQAIRSGLKALPAAQFAMERGTLLLAAARLPGQESVVQQLAYTEMTENRPAARPDVAKVRSEEELNRAVSGSPEIVLPILAHAAYIATSPDAATALKGTVAAIQVQRDSGIQKTMGLQFVNRYPAMEGQLRAAFPALPRAETPTGDAP